MLQTWKDPNEWSLCEWINKGLLLSGEGTMSLHQAPEASFLAFGLLQDIESMGKGQKSKS